MNDAFFMPVGNDGPAEDNGTGLAGRLLISMPQLEDGPFAHSVVLICEHDEDHAFGIIVNKPVAGVVASDAVKETSGDPALSGGEAPVYFGGPCEPSRGFVLHTDDYHHPTTHPIRGGFGLTANREALGDLQNELLSAGNSRLIAGHSGWSAGQLDDELRKNYWLDIEATPQLVFDTPAEELWATALAQIGIAESSLSAMGADTHAGSRPLS